MLPGSLGSLHHPIRTASADAQELMDQGLTLYYGFNRDAARRTFEVGIRADGVAPMLQVGLALALGPNLNMDASAMDLHAACEAAQRATSLALHDDERGYAAALTTRYCSSASNGLNAGAYVESMRGLHRAYPQDLDAAVLYADSLLELRPRAVRHDVEITAVLESVLERQPDHVGANHYYIHAVEGTTTPRRGLASAKRLETLVPASVIFCTCLRTSTCGRATTNVRSSATGKRPPLISPTFARIRRDMTVRCPICTISRRLRSQRDSSDDLARRALRRRRSLASKRNSRVSRSAAASPHRSPWSCCASSAGRMSRHCPFPKNATPRLPSWRVSHGPSRSPRVANLPKRAQNGMPFLRAMQAIPGNAYYRGNPISVLAPAFEAAVAARLAAETDAATAAAAWERAVAAQDRLE